jgi:periplasmic protein CpxP/Spy
MVKKRNGMSIIVVMFCLAALTSFSGIAQAHNGEWGGDQAGCANHQREHDGKHHHHDFNKFAKKLGLTEAQKVQAKAIFQGNKDLAKPIVTSLRAEHKNLQALIHADTVDEAAIRAETAKISGIKADLIVNRAKAGAKFRAILTPAQLTILKTLHEKSHEHGRYNHCSHE